VVREHNDDGSRTRTKVDDVKHFYAFVLRDARELLPIRTRGDTDDGHHVRAIMLDKLDACLLLLPQLQVTIDRRRDDKVRSAFRPSKNSG
jgi:hypothetical protein